MSYILVADDNRDYADSLVRLLALLGHSAVSTYDGQSALARFRESVPCLVVLDMNLPDMSGYDVAAAIRQEPGGDIVTIVAITGWQRDFNDGELERVRFDGHLKKPVAINLLSPFLPRSVLLRLPEGNA